RATQSSAALVNLIGIRAISRMATKRRKPRPVSRAGLWGAWASSPFFFRSGALVGVGVLAVLLAAARPDQGVALAIRIIEQVGEDGRVEARIVELEGAGVPALVRLLRPTV